MGIVPVFYQIKQTLKDWIINGEFKAGERIPTENELARRFRTSRVTVRQALSQLAQEGFLVSRRGDGTFVTDDEGLIDSFSLEFTGFMDDLLYQVSRSETKSVKISRVRASESVRKKLRLGEAEKEVVQIKRTKFKGDRSFAYVINYLPLEIGERMSEGELYDKPLLHVLEKDFGIHFGEALQTIEASFADHEVAEKLEIPSGSPILLVERIMYGEEGKPIELVRSSYRGDVFKYVARLKHVKDGKRTLWAHQTQ